MSILEIKSPLLISKFKPHDLLKNKLLELIEISPGDRLIDGNSDISKTDWNVPKNVPRDYLNIFEKPIIEHLKENYSKIGITDFNIHNFWFQQYTKNSNHVWHSHGNAHYTNVYYLELPEGTPRTELLNPMNLEESFFVDVQEGDIISFPAFVFHRSTNVQVDSRKTVISFNSSFLDVEGKFTND